MRYRNRTGKGQWVDLSMYQSGVMFISEYVMDYMVNGRQGERIGNRHPYRAPQGCYPASGVDQWVVLSVGSDQQWANLCRLMDRPDLAEDPRFSDILARRKNHDDMDTIIAGWTAGHEKYQVMEMLQSVGIPSGPVFANRDTHLDPHLKARGFLEHITFPEDRGVGTRPFIGRPYQFSKTPVSIKGPAPLFGQHSAPIITGLLGVSNEDYASLEQDGITASAPTTGEPNIPVPFLEQVSSGRLADWDPDYKDKLGIP